MGSGGGVQLAVRGGNLPVLAMHGRRDERAALAMLIREGRVEPGGVGLPAGESKFRQEPSVGHGCFGHLHITECRHTVKSRGQVSSVNDGGVAEVQVMFV